MTSHYLYEENSLADVIMVDHYDYFPVHVVEYLIYSCDLDLQFLKTITNLYETCIYLIIRKLDGLQYFNNC